METTEMPPAVQPDEHEIPPRALDDIERHRRPADVRGKNAADRAAVGRRRLGDTYVAHADGRVGRASGDRHVGDPNDTTTAGDDVTAGRHGRDDGDHLVSHFGPTARPPDGPDDGREHGRGPAEPSADAQGRDATAAGGRETGSRPAGRRRRLPPTRGGQR